jgi:hypothetical protein
MLDEPPCTRIAWPVQTKEGPSGGEPQPEPFGSGRATRLPAVLFHHFNLTGEYVNLLNMFLDAFCWNFFII